MHRLIKISGLSGFRFFNDFKWDEDNCKLFERYNIVYGWNGSGKTTLCDFFRCLETQTVEPDVKVSMIFGDAIAKKNEVFSHNRLNNLPSQFRVFHGNYIRESISEVDSIKHIFAVGANQRERVEEAKVLKNELEQKAVSLRDKQRRLAIMTEDFETMKTKRASSIKTTANLSSAYNKNKFYASCLSSHQYSKITKEEYQKAQVEIRAELRESIAPFDINRSMILFDENIESLLEDSPINRTIDTLVNNPEIGQWVAKGLIIHDKNETGYCHFCGNSLGAEHIEALKAHFNQSYNKLLSHLENVIAKLNEKRVYWETSKSKLPNPALLYVELREDAKNANEMFCIAADRKAQIIQECIAIVEKKKTDIANAEYGDMFREKKNEYLMDDFPAERVNDVVKAHNRRTEEFEKSLISAQKKIEEYMVLDCIEEVKMHEKEISQEQETIRIESINLSKLRARTDELDKEIKDSQIPVEKINADIAFIMGRDELVFINKQMGYQIMRNGKVAKNLSKGEENAIALIYFFNSFLDADANIDESIVVLDDPISSFDTNFYYNAISYIRDKTSSAGQVFIFTHKHSLVKDYALMYKDEKETKRYLLQRRNGSPELINEDAFISQFHDEYAFLFKKVYTFVHDSKRNLNDYLLYPNIARRLLEGFLTFKVPTNNMTQLDKVLRLEEKEETAAGRAMQRLLNNYSHLNVIPSNDKRDDVDSISVLPQTLQYLLDFIKEKDEYHYMTLADECANDIDVDEHTPVNPEKKLVYLYDFAASAGSGFFAPDEHMTYDEIEVENIDCTFAVRLSGDSMEPEYPDGCIVLVKETESLNNADIGIILYDGELYCKKYVFKDGRSLLVSLNRKYKAINITEENGLRIQGKVIGIHCSGKE